MRFFRQNNLINLLHHSAVSYAPPSNLSYLWNFGILALFCLIVQIITGIFLAMHYVANTDLAFSSVERIMRDVQNGWLLRYVHENGASMFFVAVYVHFFRAVYYGSYLPPRALLWCSGVIILLVMIATAFLGYILPWGQMSFWAATVITNLFSAIPSVGYDFVYWLWGGQSIGNATLNRFFSLHYLLPFVLFFIVVLHLAFLHTVKSNNPVGVNGSLLNIAFSPYYAIKDIYGLLLFLILFVIFVFFYPNYLGHPDNYIMANPLVTPNHIVPEWYFLPLYAILRAIPSKEGGALILLASIITLIVLPFIADFFSQLQIRSSAFKPLYQFFFWIFVVDCIALCFIGGTPVVYPYFEAGQAATVSYFIYFFIGLPATFVLDKSLGDVEPGNIVFEDSYRYTCKAL